MNEAHAAQVREIELFTVDYFAPPPRRVRVLRPIDDKKIRDTIEFQGSARDTLDAIWQAVGRPNVNRVLYDGAVRTVETAWRRLNTEGKIQAVRDSIRGLETME